MGVLSTVLALRVALASAATLIISLFAYYPYARSTLKGETHPKKASWLIWFVVDAIMFAALWSQSHFSWSHISWQVTAYVAGTGAVLLIALKKGDKGWTREDKIVLGLAAASLLLWHFTTATMAVLMSLMATTLGSYPTWKHMAEVPGEKKLPWVLWWIGGIFGLFALQHWNFESGLMPVAVLAMQSLTVGILTYNGWYANMRSGTQRRNP